MSEETAERKKWSSLEEKTPRCTICRNGQREYFLQAGKVFAFTCWILWRIEYCICLQPCAAAAVTGEARARDDVPGRCVSDFWAWCFWLQEHRVCIVWALAALCSWEVLW